MALIFPSLPGLAWSVTKTPIFQTRIQRAVSGRESRALDYPYCMQATFSAGPGSSQVQIASALSPTPSNLYVQGTLTGITGANAGSSRTVAEMGGGWVHVKLAFASPVLAGDQFQLLPGCDRTFATCTNLFNNAAHFGGFPYIPTPETAV